MEPDLVNEFVPGDIQPEGIAPLLESQFTGGTNLPPLRDLASNVIKNQALKYAGQKLGINQLGMNALGSLLGVSNVFAPLTAVSALSEAAGGIANILRNKRTQKAIERNIRNDNQGNIQTVDLRPGMQPTPQDIARGTIGSRTTSAPSSVPSSSDKGAALHG